MTAPLPFTLTCPPAWTSVPFGRVVNRSKESGQPEARSLSVFIDQGVVPRDTREDNHNRLGDNLANYLVVRKGDIVFNKLRTWQGGLGVSRFDGIVSPAYFVCRPTAAVEARFLHYVLRSHVYLEELTRISKFMPPSQFDIAWDDLKVLPIVLPPAATQRAIADYLDRETARIDALIAAKQWMVDLLEERFIVLREELVSGTDIVGNRVPGPWWLHSYPAHWTLEPLRYLAGIDSGHTPDRKVEAYWTNCTIPWVTLNDVGRLEDGWVLEEATNLINELGMANSAAHLLPALTVILSRDATVGRACLLGRPMAISQHFVGWTSGPRLVPEYLLAVMRGPLQRHFQALAAGATIATIGMPELHALHVPVPPIQEQQAIVARLREVEGVHRHTVGALRNQMVLLREQRQSLVTAAVTGELEIPGAAA